MGTPNPRKGKWFEWIGNRAGTKIQLAWPLVYQRNFVCLPCKWQSLQGAQCFLSLCWGRLDHSVIVVMGRASPSECVELTLEVTLYGDSSGSDCAFGILCSTSQEGKCSALTLKGGRRWTCALKGCKERRLATFSCLRLDFTVLRIFME